MNRTSIHSASRALLLLVLLSGTPSFAQTTQVAITQVSTTPVAAVQSAPRVIDAAQTKVLQDAIKSKNWDSARASILSGADVNTADKNGVTPLMRAADAGQSELVQALLRAGANPGAVDKRGQSALHYAVPADPKPKKKFGFGQIAGVLTGGLSGLVMGGGIGGLGSLLGGGGIQNLLGGNLSSLLSGGPFNLGGATGWSAVVGSALQGDAGGKFGLGQLLSGTNAGNLDASGWTNLLSSVKGAKPEILGAMSNLGNSDNADQSALWSQFLSTASSGDQAGVEKLMQNPDLAPLLKQATAGLSSAASQLPGNAARTIIAALVEGGAKADMTDNNGKTANQLAQERGVNDLFATQ